MNKHYDQGDLKDAVDNVQASGGSGTVTDQALQLAINQVFTREGGDRSGVSNAVLLVTNGKSTGRTPLASVGKTLRKSGTAVYVIGVGPATDPKELRDLASGDDKVYSVKNVYELIKMPSRIVKIIFDNTHQSKFFDYPILSYPILSYVILSYVIQCYSILSYLILSYPVLSCHVPSCAIPFRPTPSFPISLYLNLSHHPPFQSRTISEPRCRLGSGCFGSERKNDV